MTNAPQPKSSGPKQAVIKWLLDGDPSIRWQVMRDFTDAPDAVIATERSRIAETGWGAALLGMQSPEGNWGGEPDKRHWMITMDALVLLKEMGLDPEGDAARRAIGLVREHITWWQLDGRPYFEGETEPCINGRILGTGAYFGEPTGRVLERLLGEQLEDGGWNCEAPPSSRSSFNTTICVLEGLLDYERAHGADAKVTEARVRGQEYLLERRMFRLLSSGAVIDRKWMKFSYPNFWHYDVLRGLHYLSQAGVEPDERVAEAVDLVAKGQHQNGRWPRQFVHDDRTNLEMEGRQGTASRWITLRALRVLEWYSGRSKGNG